MLLFVLDFTPTPSPSPPLSPLHAPPQLCVALSTASQLLLLPCQYETGGIWRRRWGEGVKEGKRKGDRRGLGRRRKMGEEGELEMRGKWGYRMLTRVFPLPTVPHTPLTFLVPPATALWPVLQPPPPLSSSLSPTLLLPSSQPLLHTSHADHHTPNEPVQKRNVQYGSQRSQEHTVYSAVLSPLVILPESHTLTPSHPHLLHFLPALSLHLLHVPLILHPHTFHSRMLLGLKSAGRR